MGGSGKMGGGVEKMGGDGTGVIWPGLGPFYVFVIVVVSIHVA